VLSKALDADLGLVDLRRAEGDPVGTASALTTVAGTMRDARPAQLGRRLPRSGPTRPLSSITA